MNVQFYGVHARTGANQLLASIGVAADEDTVVVHRDTYVRHHREQREGDALEVRGGVLDVSPTSVRLYEELANPGTGELAATFVLAFELADRTSRAAVALAPEVVASAEPHRIELPEHGRWRSISPHDDVVASAPLLELLQERDLVHRQVRTITPQECDEDRRHSTLSVDGLV